MCFAFDAQPPELPADLALPRLAGGAAAEMLEVTSADGTEFAAAFAQADTVNAANLGVAIIPDVRGLYPFYVTLAERFAEAGYHAITIDPFGRTAGVGARDEDFDWMPHVMASSDVTIRQDVAAALAALRERVGEGPNVIVGFCFGGSQAFLAATDPALDANGVIGFYGGLDGTRLGIPSPKEHSGESIRSVLALFGGADDMITPEMREEFAAGLEASGVDHDIFVYEGAPHSFFDRSYDEHAEACEDAWRRVISYLEGLAAKAGAAAR